MAATTTMSSKGQVIIPKDVREALSWTAGTELVVEASEDGVTLRAATPFPRTEIKDVVGCAGYRGPRRSLAEMKAGIARGARASGR